MSYQRRNVEQAVINGLLDLLRQHRDAYEAKRHIFIKGPVIRDILSQLGASDRDIERLKVISEDLRDDPTLAYRLTRNGRFCMDFENEIFKRLEFQPFILTATENFVRHDSGIARRFRGIQDDLQRNPAFLALMQFKAIMIDGLKAEKRRALDYDTRNWISTVFHVRTITSTKILGQPAAEGAHCDGVDHTMTTFLGSQNMGPGSGVSQIHAMAQKTGITWDEVDESLIHATVQHGDFLDTLMIFDNERKHTVSPVFSADPSLEAQRDMLVVFTRKPAMVGHPSYEFDSQNAHPDMPFEARLSPLEQVSLHCEGG